MKNHYTVYWSYPTCKLYNEEGKNSEKIGPIEGTQFVKRKIKNGDQIFILSYHKKDLYLVGKLVVDKIISNTDNLVQTKTYGTEQIIPSESTQMIFDRIIPFNEAIKLTFNSISSPNIKLNKKGNIEPQSLRSVRELTLESVTLLDNYLEI